MNKRRHMIVLNSVVLTYALRWPVGAEALMQVQGCTVTVAEAFEKPPAPRCPCHSASTLRCLQPLTLAEGRL